MNEPSSTNNQLTGPNSAVASSKSSQDFDVCRYQPEVIPAILTLLQETLGNAPAIRKTPEFWNWKHEASPFGSSYGLCASVEAQQKIVGLRVLMRWSYRTLSGDTFQAVRAVDTATHPAYQRRGIFSTLTRQAIDDLTNEGVHFIFNTPNQRSLPGYLKLGWQVVTTWPVFIKVLKPVRMLSRRLRFGPALPAVDQFEAFFGPDILPWSLFADRYGTVIPPLVAGWERQRRQVGLRTPRDVDYLQWRYGQHPHLTYGVYPLENSEGLTGFAVLRPNLRNGWQEIVLTDIFLLQPDPELSRAFLRSLIKQLRGDYLIAHFAEETVERELIRRTGFLRVPKQGLTFTVRALNLPWSKILNPATWDLTLGDLEVF